MTILIPFQKHTGIENMQIDNDLLDRAIRTKSQEPIFRLYGWSPACVSLGRNQNEEFINKKLLMKNKIDIVRRITGGRAIFHDQELTYSYVCPVEGLESGQSVVNSYKEISKILIEVFDSLGIKLEFMHSKKPSTKFDYCMSILTGADLMYQGKKLVGSAQYRKEGYILQHGSILFDYNQNFIEEIFSEQIDKTAITSIKEISPSLDYKIVIDAFTKFFEI